MRRVRALWDRLRGTGRIDDASSGRPMSPENSVPPSRLVVGLGNPGPKYEATRHNVGFRILDRLVERAEGRWTLDRSLEARVARVEIEGEPCVLLEPQTFMNRSGQSVAAALARWPDLDPASDVLVVYDDMDLDTGRVRLRPSGGDGGHRGIGDILDALETKRVPRLRFGVGHPGSADAVLDWVLRPFSPEEEATVLVDSVERAADAVEATIREGLTKAMGRFNAA